MWNLEPSIRHWVHHHCVPSLVAGAEDDKKEQIDPALKTQ